MKIELKNIKHAEFASQETHCYSASLYVDGKRIGTVSNEGHGGSDMFDAHKASENDDWGWTENMGKYDAACEYIASHQEEFGLTNSEYKLDDFYAENPHEAMGSVCADLVNEFLIERDIKKALKRRIMFTKEGETGIFELKAKFKPTKENFDRLAVEKPEWKVINNLPMDEIKALWRAA